MIKPKDIIKNICIDNEIEAIQDIRLRLNNNENIYEVFPSAINTIKNTTCEDVFLYPDDGKLIDKLSSKYSIDKQTILLTTGCDDAINTIINTYVSNEDEILTYSPCSEIVIKSSIFNNGKLKLLEYDEKFVFNKEKISQNINSKTKIVYIDATDDLTGALVRVPIIDILSKRHPDVLFVINCSYINYVIDSAIEDYLDLTVQNDNVIIIKSFSKDYALAGLRLGFIVSNKENIFNLKKIIPSYNINSIAINCAVNVLNDDKVIDKRKDDNEEAKQALLEVLKNHNLEPYPSQTNSILCDFKDYCDFYYQKFKNNGVLVKKFPKNSNISTCLRITVPKLSGVKYISELLNIKDVLIFDLDGVVFDARNSYLVAIQKTFSYFTNKEISIEEIMQIKNIGNMDCDWDATKYLLQKYGFNVEISEIIGVFRKFLFDKNDETNFLIDKEKLLISKDVFEELVLKYDLVVFSGRLKDEMKFSLKKFGIEKYFSYFITSDDLPKNMIKPHPKGVLNILQHCPHLNVQYLGDSIDDIISGKSANVETIGVVFPSKNNPTIINNFRHLNANYILDDISDLLSFLKDNARFE